MVRHAFLLFLVAVEEAGGEGRAGHGEGRVVREGAHGREACTPAGPRSQAAHPTNQIQAVFGMPLSSVCSHLELNAGLGQNLPALFEHSCLPAAV